MPETTPRKTTARKPSAAVAARREVRAEKGTPATLQVKFRGESFDIPTDRLGSSRVYMRQKFLEQFGATNDAVSALLFELLGQADSGRFINLCGPDDTLGGSAAEFIAALNKAGNTPNS